MNGRIAVIVRQSGFQDRNERGIKMALALALHVIAAVIWVGGMLFAHMMLRPVAAAQLEPPQRLTLWVGVFLSLIHISEPTRPKR